MNTKINLTIPQVMQVAIILILAMSCSPEDEVDLCGGNDQKMYGTISNDIVSGVLSTPIQGGFLIYSEKENHANKGDFDIDLALRDENNIDLESWGWGTPGGDVCTEVINTRSQNFAVIGKNPQGMIFLITNPDGTWETEKVYTHSEGLIQGYSINECDNGDFLLGGTLQKEGETPRLFLKRVSATGDEKWQASHALGNMGDHVFEVCQSISEGYMVFTITSANASQGHKQFLMLLFNENDELLDFRPFGMGTDLTPGSVLQVSDGFLVCGSMKRSEGAAYSMYLIKIDNQANLVWEANYEGEYESFASCVASDENGYAYVVGASRAEGATNRDILIVEFTDQGIPGRHWSYGGSGDDHAAGAIMSEPTVLSVFGTSDFYNNSMIKHICIDLVQQ